jgi:hypothetical protein
MRTTLSQKPLQKVHRVTLSLRFLQVSSQRLKNGLGRLFSRSRSEAKRISGGLDFDRKVSTASQVIEESNRVENGIIYFKFYQSQIAVIEEALATAALRLGSDKSRGYCLEMICADFLAGSNLDNDDPTVLLQSMSRFFKFLPGGQRQAFLHEVIEKAS